MLPGIAAWLLLAAGPLQAVEEQVLYEGTTSQGKSISIYVFKSAVIVTVGWSCGPDSGTYELHSWEGCGVHNDSFSCGSAWCELPWEVYVRVEGTFSGASVSGSIDLAYQPCFDPLGGCTCCTRSNITYTAMMPVPEISIDDISVTEGDSGTTAAEFEVSRTYDGGYTATVDWATSHGTADSGDYVPASGTVTFGSGQNSEVVSVLVSGDTDPELNETFYVDLSNPVNATIADPQGECRILDDDRSTRRVSIILDGMESMDGCGDPDNYVMHRRVARTHSTMTGVGYSLSLETVGASWLSDFVLYADGSDRDGAGLHLRPAAGDDHSGAQSYSSPVVSLASIGMPEIPILDDGKLYIEFYEDRDDYPGSSDGHYNHPSSVTVEHTVTEIFSDGFESGDLAAWSSSVP